MENIPELRVCPRPSNSAFGLPRPSFRGIFISSSRPPIIMVKLGTVSRMSSFTLFKFCFLNLLSDPFGLPRPFGVVVGVFVDRVSAFPNSALIVFLLSDPFGLPRPLGVIWGLPRFWFTTVGFGPSSSCGIVALLSAYKDLKLQLNQNEKFQGTEVGALFLLISGTRMRIFQSRPSN